MVDAVVDNPYGSNEGVSDTNCFAEFRLTDMYNVNCEFFSLINVRVACDLKHVLCLAFVGYESSSFAWSHYPSFTSFDDMTCLFLTGKSFCF